VQSDKAAESDLRREEQQRDQEAQRDQPDHDERQPEAAWPRDVQGSFRRPLSIACMEDHQ
jgi:hypothetical protein